MKAAAVAVVAHAVLGMAKSLTPDARRATIAVAVMASVVLVPGSLTMLGALFMAGILGLLVCRPQHDPAESGDTFPVRVRPTVAGVSLVVFGLLLGGLPILTMLTGNAAVGLFDMFYRTGSLVFGGGHAPLPRVRLSFQSFKPCGGRQRSLRTPAAAARSARRAA